MPYIYICFMCWAKSLQSSPTFCNSMDYSPPGSSVHRILQARVWSGLPCPSTGNLTDPEIKPKSHISIGRWALYYCHLGSPIYTYIQCYSP